MIALRASASLKSHLRFQWDILHRLDDARCALGLPGRAPSQVNRGEPRYRSLVEPTRHHSSKRPLALRRSPRAAGRPHHAQRRRTRRLECPARHLASRSQRPRDEVASSSIPINEAWICRPQAPTSALEVAGHWRQCQFSWVTIRGQFSFIRVPCHHRWGGVAIPGPDDPNACERDLAERRIRILKALRQRRNPSRESAGQASGAGTRPTGSG